jgi:dihydroxyacid dehydratase/phosphogluconate dehydratase
MSLPYSSSNPALSQKKNKNVDAGKAIKILLEKISNQDIMTREAFENKSRWLLF